MSELTAISTFILVDPDTGKVRPELAWMPDRFGAEGALAALDVITRGLCFHRPCPVCWQPARLDRRRKLGWQWKCGHVKMVADRLYGPALVLVLGPRELTRLRLQAKKSPPPPRRPRKAKRRR